MADSKHAGRHRLGTPGLVHCVVHHSVAMALEDYRRTWLSTLLVPAKHSFAGLRRKARRRRSSASGSRPSAPAPVAVTARAA